MLTCGGVTMMMRFTKVGFEEACGVISARHATRMFCRSILVLSPFLLVLYICMDSHIPNNIIYLVPGQGKLFGLQM